MRRLQIYLDEELDEALAAEAQRRSTSKAALIRAFVSNHLKRQPDRTDPFDRLIGKYPGDPGDIDDVVYGGGTSR